MWPPESIWNDPEALASYYTLYPIPLRPRAGILILSIIVSILGSYASLLCLGRRTGSKGWRNHIMLFASAICFASVGVWGMHFVSMISMRLQPSPKIIWFLMFSPGMTSLSLFVPLLATIFAFWFLGDEAEYSRWRLPFVGVFVGLTIGLMHYSASFQLPLHDVSNSAITVIFALLLACVAATAALFTFFKFRSQWVDSWWRRGLCAIFLAIAVCGMHYLGLGGTSYRVKDGIRAPQLAVGGDQSTRLIISISVMCGAIILLAIGLFVYDHYAAMRTRSAARHIVIVSAAFDEYGRMLVKCDGGLPMQVIQTDAEIDRVMAQVDPRNPTFQWLYLLSFNWGLVRPFVRRMYRRMHARNTDPKYVDPINFDVNLDQSYDNLMFRTRFLEAAVTLAQSLDIAVESLGTLFDRVLPTGSKGKVAEETKEIYENQLDDWASDYGGSVHGITLKLKSSEGVMLFLVRELGGAKPFYHLQNENNEKAMISNDHMDSYSARGYRLAEPRFFARSFGNRVGVNTSEMEVFLSACKTASKRAHKHVSSRGGAYVSLYGVRPCGRGTDNDLEVLVYNFAHHQIPSFRLPEIRGHIDPEGVQWLQKHAGRSMNQLLKDIAAWGNEHGVDMRRDAEIAPDTTFGRTLCALSVGIEGIVEATRAWPNIMHDSRLSADIVYMPSKTDENMPVQNIMFEVVLPAPEIMLSDTASADIPIDHMDSVRLDRAPAPFIYTPFSLFCKVQSQIYRGPRYRAHARITTAELNRLYPPVLENPVDIVREEERLAHRPIIKPIGDSVARIRQLWQNNRGGPRFDMDPTQSYPYDSPGSVSGKGSPTLSCTTDGEKTLVRPTNESTMSLQIPKDTRVKRGRPGTAEEVMHKLGQLVGRNKEAANSNEKFGQPLPSPTAQQTEQQARWAWVRDVYDGWYIRHTEWLEETDRTGMMEGNAWRVQAIGPGGM